MTAVTVGWTTADYALIVSIVSLCFAVASFVWNVWSKFIFPKPRIEVKISFSYAVGVSSDWPAAISLTAINHGPLEVTLKGTLGFISPSFPFGSSKRAILRAYRNWPHSFAEADLGETPGLPTRLPVGEQCSVFFPPSLVEHKELRNLGFSDGFGREHFADSKSSQQFRLAARKRKLPSA